MPSINPQQPRIETHHQITSSTSTANKGQSKPLAGIVEKHAFRAPETGPSLIGKASQSLTEEAASTASKLHKRLGG